MECDTTSIALTHQFLMNVRAVEAQVKQLRILPFVLTKTVLLSTIGQSQI